MRLGSGEAEAIALAARDTFGDDVTVRLFGSRVDDNARGGEIDLLIAAHPDRVGIHHESRFPSRLFEHIDEHKVDVVLVRKDLPLPPFAAMVMARSVPLT